MRPSEFMDQMARLTANFGKPHTVDTTKLWMEAFGHLDAEPFADAVNAVIVSERWWPTIAAMSEAVADRIGGTRAPADAFAGVLSYIRSEIDRDDVDDLALETAEDVGWNRIEDSPDGCRRLFIEAYAARRSRRAQSLVRLGSASGAMPSLEAGR